MPHMAGHRFVGHDRHAGIVRTAFRCRAYPDQAQQAVLNRTFGCVRVVWNHTLAARRERYTTGRKGISDFAVTSEEERIANPRHLERKARNLARYQRRLARCRNGSANRAGAKAKVARAHRKVRNARRDFLHRASTRLVRENDVIVIEDLNVSGMVRNRHLARAISDCGWGEFRRQLAYKCQRYGRQLVVIDRWYPSSKTCSACGHLLAELNLSTRTWRCPSCGARHDRDVNAAKNILAAGQAVAACGADVSHSGTPGCSRL